MLKNFNIKNKLLFCVLALLLPIFFLFLLSCESVAGEAVIKTEKNYKVVKVGESVVIDELYAENDSGEKFETEVLLFDADGNPVEFSDKIFTPDKAGKFTAIYCAKNVKASPLNFNFYVTETGSEFYLDVRSDKIFSDLTVEWGERTVLPQVNFISVIDGKTAPTELKVYAIAENGEENRIELKDGAFTPDLIYSVKSDEYLSKYLISYECADTSVSFTVKCVDNSAPEILFEDYSEKVFVLGKSCIVPEFELHDADYEGLSDAQLKEKYSATLYKENSNEEIAVNNGRFIVDGSKYFTYKVVARDNSGRVAEKSVILTREFNPSVDTDMTDKLSGAQVMNFDSPYYTMLVKGKQYLDYEIEGGNLVLTSTYFDGGAKLSFLVPKTVAENDFIAIRIKSSGRVVLDNENGSSLSGNDVYFVIGDTEEKWSYEIAGSYQTVIFPVVKLGYSVGDKINGLYLCNWEDEGEVNVDYIEYLNFADCNDKSAAYYCYAYTKSESLIDDLDKSAYEIMNFDNDDYNHLIIKQGNSKAEVINGVLTVKGSEYNGIKLIFTTPQTVGENDFLIIRLQAKARLTIADENGVAEDFKELINNNYSETWVYKTSSDFIDVMLPVKKLGYSENDVIRGICLKNHNSQEKEFYIDSVKYLKYGKGDDIADQTVLSFVKDVLVSQLDAGESVNFENTELYSMLYKQGTVSDGVYTSCESPLSVELIYPKKVVAEDYIIIKLRADFDVTISDENGNNTKQIVGSTDGYGGYSWCVSYGSNYKNVVLPVSDLGYSEGDTVSKIILEFSNDKYLRIDSVKISVSDTEIETVKKKIAIAKLKDGLKENQVANFDDTNYKYLISDYDLNYNYVSYSGEYRNSLSALTDGKIDKQKLIKISFVVDKTITQNTYFVLRIKSTNNIVVYNQNKTTYKYVLSTDSAVYSALWSYKAKSGYTTAIIPATVLGYKSGDTANALFVGNAANKGMFFVDYIETVEMPTGLNELTAVATYYDLFDNAAYGLSGYQVMNFDNEGYSEYVTDGEVVVENDAGYFVHSDKYFAGKTKITFIEPLQVTETAGKTNYVVIRIKATGRVAIDGENLASMNNTKAPNYPNYVIVNGKPEDFVWAYLRENDYQTVIVPVSYLGYGAGDTVNCLYVTNWDEKSSLYIDYIEYVEMSDVLTKANAITEYNNLRYYPAIREEISGTDYLMTFDSENYYSLVNKGTIENGEFTAEGSYDANAVRFTFVDGKIVTTESDKADYLVLRIKINSSGSKRVVIGVLDANMSGAPATTASSFYYLFHDGYAANEWIYSATGEYQTIIIPVSALGYSAGDAVYGFKLTNWEGGKVSYSIDYIKYVTMALGLTEAQAIESYNEQERAEKIDNVRNDIYGTDYVMTFDIDDYYALVNKGKIEDGQFSYGTQYQWVTFTFADAKTATAESGKEDYIAIRIKSNVRTRIQNYESSNAKDIIHTASNEYGKEWIYQNSGEYQTIIIPVSALGYSAGDTVKGVQLAVWVADTFYVDYIEYVTMTAGLTESQALAEYENL